jgi:putative ABC transport system substrate-binding protein
MLTALVIRRNAEVGRQPGEEVRNEAARIPGRTYRLGHLANTALSESLTREIALPELAKLGFLEGPNLAFDGRVGEPDAQPGLMRELLATGPDAVIAIGPAPLAAAGAATRMVPIVTFGFDPVELGLAQSYARPGGKRHRGRDPGQRAGGQTAVDFA